MSFIHRPSDKVLRLKEIPLFQNLPRAAVEQVAHNLDEVSIQPGQVLIQEGEHNSAFWIILEGEAEIFYGGELARTIGPGKFFGATSMLDGRPAIGTARAKTALRALVASQAQFRALQAHDAIAVRLMSHAMERMREDLEAQQHGH